MRGTDTPADEYYLAAQQAVIEAVGALAPGENYTTPDGGRIDVKRKTPLRVFLLQLRRWLPGEPGWTEFTFQRNGRVTLGGVRKIPLREGIAMGHDPYASRSELEELAAQIRSAVPA